MITLAMNIYIYLQEFQEVFMDEPGLGASPTNEEQVDTLVYIVAKR